MWDIIIVLLILNFLPLIFSDEPIVGLVISIVIDAIAWLILIPMLLIMVS